MNLDRMIFSDAYKYMCDARANIIISVLAELNMLLPELNQIVADYSIPRKIEFARGCAIDNLFNRYIFWVIPFEGLAPPINHSDHLYQWNHLDLYDTPEVFVRNVTNIMNLPENNSLVIGTRNYYESKFAEYAKHFASSLEDIPWFFDSYDKIHEGIDYYKIREFLKSHIDWFNM